MFIPEKSIFSIIGQAFTVYGKNVKYLAVITLLAYVPVFVFREFIPQNYDDAVTNIIDIFANVWFVHFMEYGYLPEALVAAQAHVIADAAIFYMIFFGIELIFFPLSTAAAVYLAARHLSGETPTFSGMFSAALPIFPKMIITSGIVVGIMYLLLSLSVGILGGILMFLTLYISVGFVFYQHIVADTGRWGLNAISLSRFIVRGRWFRVFFGTIVIFAGYFTIASMSEILGHNLGIYNNIFIRLPFFLIQHFVLSFFAIVFALWYFDIKRFHALNFQEIEKSIIERMQQHIDNLEKNKEKEEEQEKDVDNKKE